MDTEDIKVFFSENLPFFALVAIFLSPTAIYYSLLKADRTIPFFINQLAINTWFKGIVGISLGILIGFLLNKKFGEG